MGITPKQKQLLEFIENHVLKYGYSPTQTQMAKQFGFRSLGTVQDYLKILERDGYLKKSWNGRRSVEVIKKTANTIPLVGTVAAGKPIEAIESREDIDIPLSFMGSGGDYFALRVSGYSMVEEGILPGDIVVVRKQDRAENGQIVVALINDEATIKTFQRKKGHIELLPANPEFKPILVDEEDDFKIEGVFKGLLRYGVPR